MYLAFSCTTIRAGQSKKLGVGLQGEREMGSGEVTILNGIRLTSFVYHPLTIPKFFFFFRNHAHLDTNTHEFSSYSELQYLPSEGNCCSLNNASYERRDMRLSAGRGVAGGKGGRGVRN